MVSNILLAKQLSLFLRTRGMTRLNLRNQVFEDSKLSWINKGQQSLMAFENLRYQTISATQILTKKLFK